MAAAKRCEDDTGEKEMEGIEEIRFWISWDLKEDQYLDSGDFDGVLDLGFSLGFTGKILDRVVFCWCWSAMGRR